MTTQRAGLAALFLFEYSFERDQFPPPPPPPLLIWFAFDPVSSQLNLTKPLNLTGPSKDNNNSGKPTIEVTKPVVTKKW